MTDAFSDLVLPIFRDVIDLKDSLSWAEPGKQPASPDEVKKKTREWIEGAERRAQGDANLAAEFELTRYGLVAWIDEILTESTWGQKVGWGSDEHFLEWDLYRSNLRHGQFYQEASYAYQQVELGHSSTDPLETFLLCVALGFRGQMRQSQNSFHEWIERFYAKVSEASPLSSKPFPDEPADPQARGLAPRQGASLLLTVSILCAITAITTALGYMISVYTGYRPVQ